MQQRQIGLTGGIASGKSTVGHLLEAQGWPVLDADRYARDILAPGSAASTAVLEKFGASVQQQNEIATINRAALGELIFAEATQRQWLEQLIHPLVRQRFEQELTARSAAPIVVLMVPLLFEANLTTLCTEIWLVDCDEKQQLTRMIQRDGLPEAEAKQRIACQWPLAQKRPYADQIIDNRGSKEHLIAQVNVLAKA